jgi:hypothetical protein
MTWQTATGDGQIALVETTMGRYNSLISPRLRSRGFTAQQTRLPSGSLCCAACWPQHAQTPFAVKK